MSTRSPTTTSSLWAEVGAAAHACGLPAVLAVAPVFTGKKHVAYGQEFPTGLRLTVDGQTCLFREEYDPTQLRSTIQGKLIRYLVGEGEHVSKDEPLPIEAMKMVLTLAAPESGLVTPLKPEGPILEAGDVVATLVLDDPGRVKRVTLSRANGV